MKKLSFEQNQELRKNGLGKLLISKELATDTFCSLVTGTPGYTHLQDVVRRALSFERQRLSEALDQFITPDDEVMLDASLSDDDGLHAVTSIKHHPRDFSHKQLLVEIERGHQIRELFFVARRVIAQAGLSAESVRFYASLVDYYTVYKLKRMTPAMTRLYLLCFVHDRYQRLNDHLLAALCALIRRFSDEVAIAAKESVYRHKIQANDDLGQGVKILQLFLDPAIDDQTLFIDVRVRAQDLLTVDRLERLCQHLTGDAGGFDEAVYEWQAIDAMMPKVKRNMRPLLRFLSLSGTASTRTLLNTIEGLAQAFRSGLQLPATHSTDTHGANQVNFALLHLFGYRFAPRYRDFRSKIQAGLYGFKHPNAYGHYPLKPIRRIREKLIISEWPNIERILLSLALKTTTQSVIVSKLSTYRRQNRTKKALWEFDNIIKSLYLLDYVDSPILRRNVHKALNRGEAYHRLRRAIAYAHGGRFRVRSQQEQDLWNECARLIANAVVHYNSIILSEVMQTLENRSNKAASEALKRISPLAWQHVNFYGRYRFDSDLLPIDIAAMASQLAGTGANLWLNTA